MQGVHHRPYCITTMESNQECTEIELFFDIAWSRWQLAQSRSGVHERDKRWYFEKPENCGKYISKTSRIRGESTKEIDLEERKNEKDIWQNWGPFGIER